MGKQRNKKEITLNDYLDGEIQSIIINLKEKREENPNDENWQYFSDIEDEIGNQYVDLVQEGGGVLGIALLGYTYVLEEFGIRFLSMGGTSAGAINTMLLAAAGKPHEKRTIKILDLLAKKDLYEFVDTTDTCFKNLIELLLNETDGGLKRIYRKIKIWYNLILAFFKRAKVIKNKGINPGIAFESWIEKQLQDKFEIKTITDLLTKMQPDLDVMLFRRKENGNLVELKEALASKVAVIATDLTTQSKVELPKMAELYWECPDDISPAKFVRASMSIPIFFQAYKVKNLPESNLDKTEDYKKSLMAKWEELAMYKGAIPKEVYFVDGGVVSNFPFDKFHDKNKIPRFPTWGIKLGIDREKSFDTSKILNLVGQTFNAARHMNDLNFIIDNQDEYKHLVKEIDTEGFNWLDFNMPFEKKKALLIKGAKAAADFIEDFHWSTYKELRSDLIEKNCG